MTNTDQTRQGITLRHIINVSFRLICLLTIVLGIVSSLIYLTHDIVGHNYLALVMSTIALVITVCTIKHNGESVTFLVALVCLLAIMLQMLNITYIHQQHIYTSLSTKSAAHQMLVPFYQNCQGSEYMATHEGDCFIELKAYADIIQLEDYSQVFIDLNQAPWDNVCIELHAQYARVFH